MFPLITEERFNSIALILVAFITIVPATLTAYWSRSAKKDSAEAKANSAEAKESAAAAAQEVLTNGGMSDPNPNLNDHIKYQTNMLEKLQGVPERMSKLEEDFDAHIRYANYMGQGMAEMYLHVMGKEPPRPRSEHDS